MTPTEALNWMQRQTWHHHDGQMQRIAEYARNMRGGYWMCDGSEPVTFNERGQLIDGRCRIAAVVLAEMPVELHVVGWHFGPFPHDDEQIA